MPSIDPAKLGSWFDAYAGRLVLYARQWLEAQWAEDVVQDVFIRLMAQSREPDNVKSWLFAAVRNAAISAFRSESARRNRAYFRLIIALAIVMRAKHSYIQPATAFPSDEAHCSQSPTRLRARLDETAPLPNLMIASTSHRLSNGLKRN